MQGLLPAMDELLPEVEQRFCVRHLYNNFRKKFAGKKLKELMWKAAKASYPQAFEREMKEIKAVSDEAFEYLSKIPPRHWSKSKFTYNSKCDVLVNNMSETFNSVIIGPRHKPIVTMFEEIIGYLMERWAFNRTRFDSYNGSVLPNIKKKLDKERELSRFWRCRIAGEKIYDVILIRSLTTEKYIVDLTKMECTCRRWMLTGIPCCHAITCYIDRREDPENAIPLIYRKEAYQAVYNPIILPNKW